MLNYITEKMMNTLPKGSLLYCAGPMSNLPQFNVPAFLEAAERLQARGYRVQLPADLDDPIAVKQLLASDGTPGSIPNGPSWGDCLALDVKLVSDIVDGIAVLPGWEKSRGANLETFVARLCNKPVVYESTLEPVTEDELALAWASWTGPSMKAAVRHIAPAIQAMMDALDA